MHGGGGRLPCAPWGKPAALQGRRGLTEMFLWEGSVPWAAIAVSCLPLYLHETEGPVCGYRSLLSWTG